MTPDVRHKRPAQTTVEVKRAYKKNGAQVPAYQLRKLERGSELDQRAATARAQDERRRANKKKREEREGKERLARRQLGVGLATQLVGYSHTQAQLKSGMEAFVGLKKKDTQRQDSTRVEANKMLEAIANLVDNDREPWDDLDDDALLEAEGLDQCNSRDHALHAAQGKEFLRLHGPINKAVESALDQLPGPVVELLSTDCSTDRPPWEPPPSLLHKLSPLGLPPHRLRIKVGCVVSTVCEINARIMKDSHLQILRVDHGRLACRVLDGESRGTEMALTHANFFAKYRNDKRYPFQRLQYPVRVCTSFAPTPLLESALETKKTEIPIMSDGWEEFLDSGTQIARELASDAPIPPRIPKPDYSFTGVDAGFTMEELEELASLEYASSVLK